jgi:hypothetical protein
VVLQHELAVRLLDLRLTRVGLHAQRAIGAARAKAGDDLDVVG